MKNLAAAFRVWLVFTLLLGFGYPLVVWGLGRVFFPHAAGGSFVERDGTVAGSELIAQPVARPGLFHPRASAAGDRGWEAMSSGGTNLGPTSKKLKDQVQAGVAAARAENPAAEGPVPADLVTTSASGLDPHVSPENALWQIPRVAAATGIPAAELETMVRRRTEGRFLGLFGEARVNVLLLDLDLLERLKSSSDTLVSRSP